MSCHMYCKFGGSKFANWEVKLVGANNKCYVGSCAHVIGPCDYHMGDRLLHIPSSWVSLLPALAVVANTTTHTGSELGGRG